MTSDQSFMDYVRTSTSLSREGGAAACFGTGVNLPEGAKMTTLAVWYQSDDVGADPEFSIERQRHSDGTLETVAHVVGQDDSQTRKLATVTVASTVATVDNQRYSYAFRVCPIAIQNVFRSARIRYTYSDAGD